VQDSCVSQHVQDCFVQLAISDTKFLQVARRTVKPSYFGSEVTTDLVQLCYNFFDQFARAPEQHFKDEVIRFLQSKSPDKVKLYEAYFDRIRTIEKPNVAYVISRINKFVQARELEHGTLKIIKLAQEGKFEEVRETMQKILKVGIGLEDVGLKYFENLTPTYLQQHRSNEKLIGTGLPCIDERFARGLCRTDFMCILGGYKGKKSWACVWFGCQALKQGLKVLHITHELSLEDTEKRYDMALGGLFDSTQEKRQEVVVETLGDLGEVLDTSKVEVPTIADVEEVRSVRKKMKRLGGELIIQKYPMGRCRMDDIERYLDYLESFEGFVPDVVINDYIEKMKIPCGENRRDYINDYYIQSKGIADERKLLMITVSQATREALRKLKFSQKDFAEDIRKLGNADVVFAVAQTDEMAEMNRMLFWVLAARNSPMDFGAMFQMNLDIGQFCLKSWSYSFVGGK